MQIKKSLLLTIWFCHLNGMMPNVVPLASSMVLLDDQPHALVSLLFPVSRLDAPQPCTCLDVRRYKEESVEEILRAGYVGSQLSPKKMALDLIKQKKSEYFIRLAVERDLKDRIQELEKKLKCAEESLLAKK